MKSGENKRAQKPQEKRKKKTHVLPAGKKTLGLKKGKKSKNVDEKGGKTQRVPAKKKKRHSNKPTLPEKINTDVSTD